MRRTASSRGGVAAYVRAVAASACLLLTACLGADYTSLSASVSEWDHGWQVTVEPDEAFDVMLRSSRLEPAAEWTVTTMDPAVVELVDEGVEGPSPEEPDRWPIWLFRFRAVALGEAALEFEETADGVVVTRVAYTVAAVEDACAAGQGVTAGRCWDPPDPMAGPNRGWTEWDHGRAVQVGLADPIALTLTGSALHPDAQWRVASVDSAVLDVGAGEVLEVRTPGDFDNRDTSKPSSFLPVWRFSVTGIALGTSTLALEAVAEGERVDVAEFSVTVQESVDEGEYLVQ
jgi:hypothetical protein